MDKIDRLLDAMEHPERYPSTDIEEMLQDPEVKETFDLLDKMKSSLQSIETPDIEEEWKIFETNLGQTKKSKRHWMTRFFSRNAVASVAIMIVSFTAIAAIVGVGLHSYNKLSETTPEVQLTNGTNNIAYHQDTISQVETVADMTPEIIVFDEETLESIMDRIAAYYGYEVIINNSASKSLRLYFRWNQSLPVEEIVKSLNNFEQLTITIKGKTINID